MTTKRFKEYERKERAINDKISSLMTAIQKCGSAEKKRELRDLVHKLNAERYALDDAYPDCAGMVRLAI